MARLRLVLAVICLVAVACQSGSTAPTAAPASAGSTTPPGTLAPATTAGATAAATPAATLAVALQRPTNLPTDGSCEDENSSCLGVLEAGKVYHSKVFEPTVTFKLPAVGWINEFDGGGDIGLKTLDPAGDAVIFFRDPRAVDDSVGPTIEDIAFWIESNDDLDATPFEPAKLGGLSGVVMDVRLSSGASGTEAECPVRVCVTWLHGDDPVVNDPYQWHWDWGNAGPEALRLYLLEADEGTVAVVIDSLDGTTFESLLATWEQIAPTVKFG